MAGRGVSLFSRILANFRRSRSVRLFEKNTPKLTVGSDHLGNTYFEQSGDAALGIKRRRWIEARNPDQTVVPKLPIEWDSWLRGRREQPPSEEEVKVSTERVNKGRALDRERARKALMEESDSLPDTPPSSEGRQSFPTYSDLEMRPGQFAAEKDDEYTDNKK